MTPLLLASQSPRRRELLLTAGLNFDVVSVKVSEIPDKNLNVNEQIIDIARRKARSAYQITKTTRQSDFIILAADTEVVYSGNLLGKPLDPEDAFRLLKLLSGNLHEVKTAVCLIDSRTEKELCHIETTKIQFKSLSDAEIRSYVQTGEPMDKAGAYGIQGLGGKFVEKIEGDFENVVGLPVQIVQNLLRELDRSHFEATITKTLPARVLAVSKLQSVEKISALYELGQKDFGENYVQEALKKIEILKRFPEIHWHFIGHLQKNKIKNILGKFEMIHSVDRLALAKELSHRCQEANLVQKILLQVNLANESTKGGFSKEELEAQWPELCHLPALQIQGLMTMPPLTENPEEVRLYFRTLRELIENLRGRRDLPPHPLTELSMGTSHDFKVAIEEGATIVRLGTILFGERPLNS